MTSFDEPRNFRSTQTNQDISLSTSPVEEKGRHPGQLSIRPHRSSDGVKQNTYLKQSVVYIDNKDVPTHLKDLCKMPEYRDKNFRGFITTKKLKIDAGHYDEWTEGEEICQWKTDTFLGKGAYGECNAVIDTNTKYKFVAKLMNNNTDFKDIIQEVKALSCLEHERIPKLYGMLYNKDKCYIFMELVKGHTLQYMIDHKQLDINDCKNIFKQLLEVISHLRVKGFVHSDISCNNVMFTKEHGLNLIDLGNTDLVEDISESHEDLVDVFELFLDCLASTLNNTVEKTSLIKIIKELPYEKLESAASLISRRYHEQQKYNAEELLTILNSILDEQQQIDPVPTYFDETTSEH